LTLFSSTESPFSGISSKVIVCDQENFARITVVNTSDKIR
jgi:hypothetical protein